MEDKKVRRNIATRASLVSIIIASALFSTSCSSLWSRRTQVNSVQQSEGSAPVTMVPKEQYDELARKYQELLNQSKQQISKTEAQAPVAATSIEEKKSEVQAKPEVGTTTSIDPSDLVNRIDKAIPDTASADTVDALRPEAKTEKATGPAVPTSMGVEHVNATDDIDEQIIRLREAQDLVRVNKFENALTILKDLENSKERQIVVRAKIMLGDLLFNQGEYDLASQVYEEIIKKYAFSGYVLKALGKLVACNEKLKQPEKQAKYYSLLHDFFEAS